MRISDWSSDVCSSDLTLARAHQVVDRVEQFFLRRIFADDELKVVEKEQVGGAQPRLERHHVAPAQRADEFEHELFRRHQDDVRGRMDGGIALSDRVEEVRLALSGARAEIERVELRRDRKSRRLNSSN